MAEIGIMGGTFDPIHNGHLLLGRQAYLEYGLDQVWFMPSAVPPHKKDHIVTAGKDRIKMVSLAVEKYPYFLCSDFEMKRQGNTYTAETLRLLREQYTAHRFYFIIGADSLYQIENWYHPSKVMEQAVLLVANREYEQAPCPIKDQITYLQKQYGADIRILHCKEVDISSGELREMAMQGMELCQYIPKCVEDYIHFHKLYQNPCGYTHEHAYLPKDGGMLADHLTHGYKGGQDA